MFAVRSNLLRTIRCKIATLTPCEVGNNVRFAPSSGLSHSVAPLPKCARALNRCAIARYAGSPTASAVTEGKIVKTQNRYALVRPLRRCGLSANMVVTDRTVRNPAPKMRKAASASSRI